MDVRLHYANSTKYVNGIREAELTFVIFRPHEIHENKKHEPSKSAKTLRKKCLAGLSRGPKNKPKYRKRPVGISASVRMHKFIKCARFKVSNSNYDRLFHFAP